MGASGVTVASLSDPPRGFLPITRSGGRAPEYPKLRTGLKTRSRFRLGTPTVSALPYGLLAVFFFFFGG